MKVRDMTRGLRWGATMYNAQSPAHILKGARPTTSPAIRSPRNVFEQTKCGVYMLEWHATSLLDTAVCKRCLKATEKYA